MNFRPLFVAFTLLVMYMSFSKTAWAATQHYAPDIDTRNIVTDVDVSARSITITSTHNHMSTVVTLADPKWYTIEIIIDGQKKTIYDITRGLQYMTSVEVQAGVVESISFCSKK